MNCDSNFVYSNNMGLNQTMRHSIAMNQRIIYIYDDVSDSSIAESIYYLNKLRYMDNKFQQGKRPIELQISTDGGTVTDGFSLISLIENMKSDGYEITTTCIGKAYSMGFLLSICGSVRKAYKYSKFMYHDISYGAYGKHGDVVDSMIYADLLRKDIMEIVTKYTNKSESFFSVYNAHKTDVFFTAEDMLEMKGIDLIV